MELDNIKDLWKKEEISETPDISTEQQKEIHLPLEKIRQNMKIEFWSTIAVSPFMLLLFFFEEGDINKAGLLAILILLSAIIVVNYFSKFRKLYKRISTQNFSTYTNLLNLRYELVLNTELYRSYYIAFIPIIFCSYIILFEPEFSSSNYLFMLITSTVLGSVIMIYLGKIWLKEMYGKYVVQISDLVMQMSDEKDEFVFDRSGLHSKSNYRWIKLSQKWLEAKLGKTFGTIVNVIFWGAVILFFIFALSFIIGLIIGFTSVMLN